jgi:hypothetical protein
VLSHIGYYVAINDGILEQEKTTRTYCSIAPQYQLHAKDDLPPGGSIHVRSVFPVDLLNVDKQSQVLLHVTNHRKYI